MMKRIVPYIYYVLPVALSLWLLGVSGTAAVALVRMLRIEN
jgi:formate-dependent nitrite reductase membrane component NrfD